MVTVLREAGFRFVIYLDDHVPAYVHIYGDGEMKVMISGADGRPEIVYAIAMKAGDRRKAMDIMLAKQSFLAAEWARIQETKS